MPPGDTAALAAAIGEALALDARRARARWRGARIAHIAAGFTREQMCARTIDIYEELLFPDIVTLPAEPEALRA